MRVQLTLFDYAALDSETRIVVQQRTTEIKALMKRAASDIIEIGQKLIEVKAKLGHGNFGPWLRSEFDWTTTTAWNFMQVASKFSKFESLEGFAPSALYLLAAPSTPESAREEAIERAEAGETITHQAARDIVSTHRNPPIPFVPDDEALTPYEQGIAERYTPTPAIQPILTIDPVVEDSTAQPRQADHQLLNQSKSNEWYTPREYVDAARELLGSIDVDPASNDQANAWIGATTYYTKDTNGLDKPWRGRVWLNPPYGKEDGDSNQERWTARLIEQFRTGTTTEAVCLVNAVPGNLWFAPLWGFPICFVARRIRFYDPSGELGQPTHSNVLVYLGPQIARFIALFSPFGPVAAQLAAYDGHVFISCLEERAA